MVVTDTAVTMRVVKSTAQGRDSVEETSYTFDTVYNGGTPQATVYDGAMLPQVRSLLAGRDTLTFAYGTTNAGKTYTIQGSEMERGVLPRALESLFAALDAHRARREATGEATDEGTAEAAAAAAAGMPMLDDACSYEVRATFLEVYGNDAFDLLAPVEARVKDLHGGMKRAALRLKEDRGKCPSARDREAGLIVCGRRCSALGPLLALRARGGRSFCAPSWPPLPQATSSSRACGRWSCPTVRRRSRRSRSAGSSARRRRMGSTTSRRARTPSSASSCSAASLGSRRRRRRACASSTSRVRSVRRRQRPTARGSTRRARSTRT